ncbi:MAG: hypothetical protein AB7P76_03980 [Candidatus Melainabacteria bacterium]
MTKDELNTLLDGQDLMNTLDIKTLVLDLVRDMSTEEIQTIFWQKLPDLNIETLRDYLYMKR